MKENISLSEGLDLLKTATAHKKKKSTVVVYDKEGNRLKPCTNKRARILLERGQASIVTYVPFTIQLTKETGDFLDTEFSLHKGTVQVCLSGIGQNRTEFMLKHAIDLSKNHQNVLFISSIVHEDILNDLIKQEIKEEDITFTEHFHALSLPKINAEAIQELAEQFEPDVLILDNWKEENTLRKLAKKNNVTIWYGLSTYKKLERMPKIHDMHFHCQEDAGLIIGLYGNQVAILKNRFGSTLEGKATHQKNIRFAVD